MYPFFTEQTFRFAESRYKWQQRQEFMCDWSISCSCLVKGLEPPVLTLPCTCCSTAGGLNYKPCPAGKRAEHQRQNYKNFGWAIHNVFSKSQQWHKSEKSTSEKLNGIVSQLLEMSLYLLSMISIKGVPSPITVSTKSTFRTHAKDSSYKQCPSLRPVLSENDPLSDGSLFIQIKGWRMWDTTAGFMGLRS